MKNINKYTKSIDDLISEESKDPEFESEYKIEYNKLASAAAVLKARESAGLTQRDLASISSVPQATIARIERGSNTSIETLTKIANALGKNIKLTFA
ncbi:helix-turn-helix domain-containing protein [Companilactobacillus hulinensis]|uniref:helix-turn-helix domain-containing protein n=1 Tax=Companilactobacillus hulinensis TaxID=2486007 RepID=UPI000F7A714F|nr:helix-turn-helix transcriptional regulator [Companilactobacillus hulinensis]